MTTSGPLPDAGLARLDELAGKATPGPWQRLDTGSEGCSVVSATARPGRVARLTSGPLERCQADAAFIAALDPATVRRLVAEVRRAGDDAEWLRSCLLQIFDVAAPDSLIRTMARTALEGRRP